jgi:hypothetical protein
MNHIGISPINALIYSAILYGMTAPVLIAIIFHISNNKKNNGQIYKRKNFQHSWICRITSYERCCCDFNLHATDVNVKRYRLLRFDFGNVGIM